MITKFLLYIVLIILALCQKAFCQQRQQVVIRETVKLETDSRRDLHLSSVYKNSFPVNGIRKK